MWLVVLKPQLHPLENGDLLQVVVGISWDDPCTKSIKITNTLPTARRDRRQQRSTWPQDNSTLNELVPWLELPENHLVIVTNSVWKDLCICFHICPTGVGMQELFFYCCDLKQYVKSDINQSIRREMVDCLAKHRATALRGDAGFQRSRGGWPRCLLLHQRLENQKGLGFLLARHGWSWCAGLFGLGWDVYKGQPKQVKGKEYDKGSVALSDLKYFGPFLPC